jgi:hypothetical protein
MLTLDDGSRLETTPRRTANQELQNRLLPGLLKDRFLAAAVQLISTKEKKSFGYSQLRTDERLLFRRSTSLSLQEDQLMLYLGIDQHRKQLTVSLADVASREPETPQTVNIEPVPISSGTPKTKPLDNSHGSPVFPGRWDELRSDLDFTIAQIARSSKAGPLAIQKRHAAVSLLNGLLPLRS